MLPRLSGRQDVAGIFESAAADRCKELFFPGRDPRGMFCR